MANRTIQFKRNATIANSALEAKQSMSSQTLTNGEFIIGTYIDAKSVNGQSSSVLGIMSQGKLFYIDNQTILNKLGIKDDGTVDPNAADDTFVKRIEELEDKASGSSELIDTIIEAAGLQNDGTYAPKISDKFISGATSLFNADEKLSSEIKAVEDFIGMGDDASGKSLVEKIDEISGKSVTTVIDSNTIDLSIGDASDGTKTISGDVKVSSVSGNNNIILVQTDGIYANVDYNAVTNALVINGVEKPLNAGSIVDSITYNSETEELVITYHTTTSSEPQTVKVNLNDLIEEYSFAESGSTDYNVAFNVTRSVSGATEVKADVNLIDCGEY